MENNNSNDQFVYLKSDFDKESAAIAMPNSVSLNSLDASGSSWQTAKIFDPSVIAAPVYSSAIGYGKQPVVSTYSLNDKYKTYKIIDTIVSTQKSDPTRYFVEMNALSRQWVTNTQYLTIIPREQLTIHLHDAQDNKYLNLEQLPQGSGHFIERCIAEFLGKHAAEFMEYVREEAKKDVVKSAQAESEAAREQLEIIDALKDL